MFFLRETIIFSHPVDYGFGEGGLRKRSGQGRKRFYLPGQYFLVIFSTLS